MSIQIIIATYCIIICLLLFGIYFRVAFGWKGSLRFCALYNCRHPVQLSTKFCICADSAHNANTLYYKITVGKQLAAK